MYRQDSVYTAALPMDLWRCTWPFENLPRQGMCGKVCRIHRRGGKAVVWNISKAAYDKTYWCIEKRTKAAEKCHICLKEFNDAKNKKVRDHCHCTGLYWGAAHNICNLKYRIPDHIHIVFHNLSGYDAHLFIKELGRRFNKNDIGVIAENKEKYISFNVKINVKLAGVNIKMVHKCIKIFSLGL